jgi:hypothetical protein
MSLRRANEPQHLSVLPTSHIASCRTAASGAYKTFGFLEEIVWGDHTGKHEGDHPVRSSVKSKVLSVTCMQQHNMVRHGRVSIPHVTGHAHSYIQQV